MIPGSLYPKESAPLSKVELESIKSLDINELDSIWFWSESLGEEDKSTVRECINTLKDIYSKDKPSVYEVRTAFRIIKDTLDRMLTKHGYSKKQAA